MERPIRLMAAGEWEADGSAALAAVEPSDVFDGDADIVDDDIEDGYEDQTDDDDLPHISVASLIPKQQMTECGPLNDWKMNLVAASLRCRRLWIAAGSRIFAFVLSSRGTLLPSPPVIHQLADPQCEINCLRYGEYGSTAVLCAVDMSGLLSVLLPLDPAAAVYSLPCRLPSAVDNSAWSIAISPASCPAPFIAVGTNAHRVFIHRLESGCVVEGSSHLHNIPSLDVDGCGLLIASASIDMHVRVMREGGETRGAACLGSQWGWAVRWFGVWWASRDGRTLEEKQRKSRERLSRRTATAEQAGGGRGRMETGWQHLDLRARLETVRGMFHHIVDGVFQLRQHDWRDAAGLQAPELADEAEDDESEAEDDENQQEEEQRLQQEEELNQGEEDDEINDAMVALEAETARAHLQRRAQQPEPERRQQAEHHNRHKNAAASSPSSASASAAASSASASSPPDLLLYSTASNLHLLDHSLRPLHSVSHPTPLPSDRRLQQMDRLCFLTTIPPLSLVIVASSGADRVGLYRVVRYQDERWRLEWENSLPVLGSGFGVKGLEVARVDDEEDAAAAEADDGGVWCLYILFADDSLMAFQLSRSAAASASLDTRSMLL